MTQDETWVHQFDPGAKRQSMPLKHICSPAPKKFYRPFSREGDSLYLLALSWWIILNKVARYIVHTMQKTAASGECEEKTKQVDSVFCSLKIMDQPTIFKLLWLLQLNAATSCFLIPRFLQI